MEREDDRLRGHAQGSGEGAGWVIQGGLGRRVLGTQMAGASGDSLGVTAC